MGKTLNLGFHHSKRGEVSPLQIGQHKIFLELGINEQSVLIPTRNEFEVLISTSNRQISTYFKS